MFPFIEVSRSFFEEVAHILGSYPHLLIFIVSLIGNSIPYAAVPYYLLLIYYSHRFRDPLELSILALFSGLGSTAGKIIIYLVGRGIHHVVSEKNKRNIELFGRLIGRWGFLFILIATSTPVPDDVILIPMAFVGYSFAMYIVATLIGKTMASLFIVFFGRGLATLMEDTGVLPQYIQVPLLLGISVVLMILIVRIDWADVVREYEYRGIKGAIDRIIRSLATGYRFRRGI
jgi:membrane protein YqaA with SNARE-associated domain